MGTWKIIVNGTAFDIATENGKFHLNGKPVSADIATIRPQEFHIIKDNKSYTAEIIEALPSEKKLVIRVNGNEYEVSAKNKFDLLLEKMGMEKKISSAIDKVKAPMPGKVVRVDVQAGQEVKRGDALLILEAVKMENSIKSAGEGKVKNILVKQGDAVEKGTVMIEFE